jgi:hypothetical protein
MNRRMPLWVALSAGAAVFIGCGIFFAFQDLGTANAYATIASFFLALLTAAGSLFTFARSKREQATAQQGEQPAVGRMTVRKADSVQVGPGTTANLTKFYIYEGEPRKGKR